MLLHQGNPIKVIVLMIELINIFASKMPIMEYKCRGLIEDYMKLAVKIQD